MKLTAKRIAKILSEKSQGTITVAEARATVDILLGLMETTLEDGGAVVLPGIGTLTSVLMPPAKYPMNGQSVGERRLVKFRRQRKDQLAKAPTKGLSRLLSNLKREED